MTVPLVAVLVLAVGLPLLAVWVARRPLRSRLRPDAEPDPWRDPVRRHGLSAGDASRIAEDVPRGRRLPDPRLRPVAAEWARELLERERPRLPRDPRTHGVVVVLLAVWLAVVLGRGGLPGGLGRGRRPALGHARGRRRPRGVGGAAAPRAATRRRARRRAGHDR
ncbi:hypothetical protein [Geodermatophilus pulveris]|uniref:hypothetical protein n=1 Tax=Geodermatophilus pulveris TaxID=1564159 RepID=UPI000B795872|nr:hypothetical protein [Geodermatophilus pulveris]